MRRRKYYKKRKGRKRLRGIPYIYKNKVYLGKRPKQVVVQFQNL